MMAYNELSKKTKGDKLAYIARQTEGFRVALLTVVKWERNPSYRGPWTDLHHTGIYVNAYGPDVEVEVGENSTAIFQSDDITSDANLFHDESSKFRQVKAMMLSIIFGAEPSKVDFDL